MKKLLSVLLLLCLLPVLSFADIPDLSSLSFDELITLRQQVNLALWQSDSWQSVEVPAGFYQIGADIPAGRWTITPAADVRFNLCYADKANASLSDIGSGWDGVNGWNGVLSSKKNADGTWRDPEYFHSVDLLLTDGWYIRFSGTAVFTPYIGKPDLGFN